MWSTLMAPGPSTIDRILVSSIYHVATLPHFATPCAPMLWTSVTMGLFDDLAKHVLPCLCKGIKDSTPKFSAHLSSCGRNDLKMKYSVHTHARAHSTHTFSLANIAYILAHVLTIHARPLYSCIRAYVDEKTRKQILLTRTRASAQCTHLLVQQFVARLPFPFATCAFTCSFALIGFFGLGVV